jgi:hypothetical protein
MNDSLNLHSMNCESLSFTEMTEISGGGFWSVLASIGIAAFLLGVGLMLGPGAAIVAAGLWVAGAGLAATVIAAGIGAQYDDFKPFGFDFDQTA